MDKSQILSEIRRTAEKNNGEPLGRRRFELETGIAVSDWCGVHWARWGDALQEAGYPPNEFQEAYSQEFVIDHLIDLICELGKFPTNAEIKMKSRASEDFPGHTTFRNQLGGMRGWPDLVIDRCRERGGLEDVIEISESAVPRLRKQTRPAVDSIAPEQEDADFGFVYLLKAGRYYKIGRANSAGRRAYEVGLKLPEEVETVHVIRTDDPAGIEAYWHKRFADRHKNGEWFELTSSDVKAFRRRKHFM